MIPASLKSAIKFLVPRSVIVWVRNRVLQPDINRYKEMGNNEDIFDKIYSDRVWQQGTDSQSASGDGSDGLWLEETVKYVESSEFLKDQTVLEIGCGDFSFGSRIAHLAKRYTAGDVSGNIIGQNQKRYSDVTNAEFRQLDATKDELPTADVVIIRQVLQHLPNSMIIDILANLDRINPKKVIVFEDVPSDDFQPNKDLKTAGPYTRHLVHSGVDLSCDPFSRPFKRTKEWLHPKHPAVPARLVCYELN